MPYLKLLCGENSSKNTPPSDHTQNDECNEGFISKCILVQQSLQSRREEYNLVSIIGRSMVRERDKMCRQKNHWMQFIIYLISALLYALL